MTDIGREVAQARAVLGARTAPDLRVLKAVHTGLLLLPTEHSAREWEPTTTSPTSPSAVAPPADLRCAP